MSPRPFTPQFLRGRADYRVVYAMTVWSALTLIAAVLLSRRLAGAYAAERGAALPCLATTFAVLISLAAHALWSAAHQMATARKKIVALCLTLIPPLAIAAALWTVPSAFLCGYLSALLLLALLATFLIREFSATASGFSQRFMPEARPSAPKAPAAVDEMADESAGGDASIIHWTTRRNTSGGAEAVEGSVRIHFGLGERSAVAHVCFIPPLSQRPRAECHVLTNFDGRVRIGVAEAYGLRIEARRSNSARAAVEIDVGFSADVSAAQSAAA